MHKYFAFDAKSWDILISGQNTYVNTVFKNTIVNIVHIIWRDFWEPIVTDPACFPSEQVTATELLYWLHIGQNQDV